MVNITFSIEQDSSKRKKDVLIPDSPQNFLMTIFIDLVVLTRGVQGNFLPLGPGVKFSTFIDWR